MPAPINPAALLDRVIEDNEITSAEIDRLVDEHVAEGLHLDYKSGRLIEDSDVGYKLRVHVSGLANAEGGLLVLGLGEGDPRQFDLPAPMVRGKPLTEWARSTLTALAPQLTEPPRYFEVKCARGTALVIAVPRSGTLAYIYKGGRHEYWTRNGDETVQIPDHVVSDLLLGRRRAPRLHVDVIEAPPGSRRDNGDPARSEAWFRLVVRIANDSPVWIEDVRVGLIAYTLQRPQSPPPSERQVGPHIRGLVAATDPSDSEFALSHMMLSAGPATQPIDPFGMLIVRMQDRFVVPPGVRKYDYQAALYVAVRGMDALWFQVSGRVDTVQLWHTVAPKIAVQRLPRGQLAGVAFAEITGGPR